ncbi:MAG TPA: hypothetical protein VJ672_07055 [Gemmatimonadaceae bacterium]|nr:hypothetical protein [Gemmatimonadaceae bacterium]
MIATHVSRTAELMAHRPRSLKHEYELYVEREIEDYKESVPRHVLLSIGDEAVASITNQTQLSLTELLLCDEVDRIIRARLRLPSYTTWRRRRLKALKELSRPERWGLLPDGMLAKTVESAKEGHVLVAGAVEEGPALYLAANGCEVTALDSTEDMLERVIHAATAVGLTGLVHGKIADLGSYAPEVPLKAVVCTTGALASLSRPERERAISLLQEATTDGGVHMLETSADDEGLVTREELEASYQGWQIFVEPGFNCAETFLARKSVA